jgi:phosphoribosylaminoimidazolecarboxamide formyltransferase/IMP cyclohydrolase
VKSNTIIYAKDLATVGIGAGQMSRVDRRASPRARRKMLQRNWDWLRR